MMDGGPLVQSLHRVMSTSPNSQPSPQTPEQFSAYLRARAEEAISASVHHASLSQQYLTLSQKFSALAEQAVTGVPVVQSVRQLEREAATGIPADPIGAPQVPVSIPAVPRAMSALSPGITSPIGSNGQQTNQFEVGTSIGSESVAPAGSVLFSPPARISGKGPGAAEAAVSADIAMSFDESGRSSIPEPVVAGPADAVPPVAVSKKPSDGRFRRKKFSIRKMLERARLSALEQAERVRVKVRKSDLKPQLRTTTQEVKEEIKRGGVPAMISTLVTVVALILLGLKHLEYVEPEEMPPLVAGFSNKIEQVEESLPIEPPAEIVGEQLERPVEEIPDEPEPVMEPEPLPEVNPEPMPEPTPNVPMAEVALPESPNGTIPASPDAMSGEATAAVDNRSSAGRKVMLEKYGGSAASESAVGHALEWLAARQRSNGSWDFIDVGPCANPGTINNPIGGTAYALLPFLAAGQSHKEGQYKKTVQAGLEFLMTIGVTAPAGYDLRGVVNLTDKDKEPNYAYYVHGAATLALCEAYGMTKDRKLKVAAEGAVQFLLNSQDPRGGGWRYNPQQGGSTSATTIQVMALKAAEKAGIKIPEATFKGVMFYLDSVAVDGAGRYGYEAEKKTYQISVTSMALLSRMYLGWGRDDGDLRAGVALIDKRGPYDNLYYNYFATQVVKNWGGREWERWNGRLRDDLIAWQEKGNPETDDEAGKKANENPAEGSWAPRDRDDYSKAGGRLLTTCLATLTLEVYYRYKPLLTESTDSTEVVGTPK